MLSVECGVWSVECGVWSVECGVWSVDPQGAALLPHRASEPDWWRPERGALDYTAHFIVISEVETSLHATTREESSRLISSLIP